MWRMDLKRCKMGTGRLVRRLSAVTQASYSEGFNQSGGTGDGEKWPNSGETEWSKLQAPETAWPTGEGKAVDEMIARCCNMDS